MQKHLPLLALLASSTALAGPFLSSDTRSLGMGGTGVASSKPGSAGIFNPALLSTFKESDNISLILPNVGFNAIADQDSLDAFEKIDEDNYLTNITDSMTNLNTVGVNQGAFENSRDLFVENVNGLNTQLNYLNGKPFNINADVLFAVSIPGKSLGVSVFATNNVVLEVAPLISSCDRTILKAFSDYVGTLSAQNEIDSLVSLPAPIDCPGKPSILIVDTVAKKVNNPKDFLSSSIFLAGVNVQEIGVALSREFTYKDKAVAFGVTPKLMTITSFITLPTLQNLNNDSYKIEDEITDSEKEEQAYNFDIGASAKFFQDDKMTVGAVVKNIISDSYETSAGQSFDVNPQIRVGASLDAAYGLTFAADLDVTTNKAYFNGSDSQYLSLGAEWDIFSILRLRAGMRNNLAESDDKFVSVGLGLNLWVVHFDLAGYFGDTNGGAALQIGSDF